MKSGTLRAVISAALAALSAYCGQIAVPVIILFCVVITDYVTGILHAYLRCELSSKRGWQGILKKLCYFAVVGVGAGADWLIKVAADTFSFSYRLPFAVGLLVTVWLIINELISIMENLSGIGVPMPSFLQKLIARLKTSAEQTADEAP